MTREQLLFQLRNLELQLLRPEVDDFLKTQTEAYRQKFVALSFDLRIIIMKLTTSQLSDIADRLEDLSDEIQEGIDALKGDIATLDKTVKIINIFSSVVGFAARIVGLAL